jgi:hypothetical protein
VMYALAVFEDGVYREGVVLHGATQHGHSPLEKEFAGCRTGAASGTTAPTPGRP